MQDESIPILRRPYPRVRTRGYGAIQGEYSRRSTDMPARPDWEMTTHDEGIEIVGGVLLLFVARWHKTFAVRLFFERGAPISRGSFKRNEENR